MASVCGTYLLSTGTPNYKIIESKKIGYYADLQCFLKRKLMIIGLRPSYKLYLTTVHASIKTEFMNMINKLNNLNDIYFYTYKPKHRNCISIMFREKDEMSARLFQFVDMHWTHKQRIYDTYPKLFDKDNIFLIVDAIIRRNDMKTPAKEVYLYHYFNQLELWHPNINIEQSMDRIINIKHNYITRRQAVKDYDNFKFFNSKYNALIKLAKAYLANVKKSNEFKNFHPIKKPLVVTS
jgi:hypothetical protein